MSNRIYNKFFSIARQQWVSLKSDVVDIFTFDQKWRIRKSENRFLERSYNVDFMTGILFILKFFLFLNFLVFRHFNQLSVQTGSRVIRHFEDLFMLILNITFILRSDKDLVSIFTFGFVLFPVRTGSPKPLNTRFQIMRNIIPKNFL